MAMTIDMATWPNSEDIIFAIGKRARKAEKEYGRDNVVNGSIGALSDDNGKLMTLDSVYDALSNMDRADIASYAPIEGDGEYLDSVIHILFDEFKPDSYMKAVATPGGTGAISRTIWSYANAGDPVICHDYYRGPYKTICDEFDREFITYEFLTDDYKFNIEAYKKALSNSLKNKDRAVSIINSPGNNPTGFSLTDEDWDKVIEINKEFAEEGKKVTLLLDVAYIEFAGDGKEQKRFFKKFSNLPSNMMVVVAFSMSKAYTAYGLRGGAAIGISSNEEDIDEFYKSMTHSARSNRSNMTHSIQKILVELDKKENKERYKNELNEIKLKLKNRADKFIEIAKENELPLIPYFGGFFIMIKTDHAFELIDELESHNIFLIPNKKGLRVAICAVNDKDIEKMIPIIKDIMSNKG